MHEFEPIVQQPAAQLPLNHATVLLNKFDDGTARQILFGNLAGTPRAAS